MPFAIFFDILGTSQYFNSLPDNYDFSKKPFHNNKYQYARKTFHKAISGAMHVYSDGLIFHASFSDCAYLVYEKAEEVSKASSMVMDWVYGTVPLRGGIGFGNFGIDRTLHQADGRTVSSESSFYGSALVRAHIAESCGLKGFRIFIHSSAVDELKKTHLGIKIYPEIDYSEFGEDDIQPPIVGGTVIDLVNPVIPEVQHELCFIGYHGLDRYHRMISSIERTFPPEKSASNHYEESRSLLNRLKELRESS